MRPRGPAQTPKPAQAPIFAPDELAASAHRFRAPIEVVQEVATQRMGVAFAATADHWQGRSTAPVPAGIRSLATLPAIYPEWLGDRGFCGQHRLRFPYVVGAMANGIATTRMVIAAAQAGCLGFFGAAGLEVADIERAAVQLSHVLNEPHDNDNDDANGPPWGMNLIHSPNQPQLEQATVDVYLRHRVRRVSASAYINLTPAVVHYAYRGIRQRPDGNIVRAHHIFAKVSRAEVTQRFVAPAPADIVEHLVRTGRLSQQEAALARHLPIAEDITAESDSGGHTDNRPSTVLFPAICAVRDRAISAHGYRRPIRVGAAGGLGTPVAVAAAFAQGAAYVVTGSVNQATVESGLDAKARALLAQADFADVGMAPAADMFEQGVKVQVLTRGTMFAARAHTLYRLYCSHDDIDDIPGPMLARLESDIFRAPLAQVWRETCAYWQHRDPNQVVQAERDGKHKMALIFRSYLGQASRWAIDGVRERTLDYQIWCGPAMGAFNRWTEGTYLAAPANRTVTQVALNLLEGATAIHRAHQLRSAGVPMPVAAFNYRPRPLTL